MCYKLVASVGCLGHYLVIRVKHVICKNNVLQVAEVEVSAHLLRLRRTKVKEMEARPFRTLVMQTRYREVADYFSCFWRTKSSSVGRIDLSGSRDTHRTNRAYGS